MNAFTKNKNNYSTNYSGKLCRSIGGPKIRIAVLHHALGRFGGGEKLTLLHSIYMSKRGFDVELFYGGPISNEWKEKATSTLIMKELPSGLPHSSSNIENILKVVKYLENFDTILIHHHICPFMAYYLGLSTGSKIIWYCGEPLRALWENWISPLDSREISGTIKSTSMNFYGNTLTSIFLSNYLYNASLQVLRAIDKATIRKYSKVITNSNYTGRLVKKIYGWNKSLTTVYPGVEIPKECNGQQSTKGYESADPYILAVGSMIPMKNYYTLLKAFSLLVKESGHRDGINLIIIGSGALENDIRYFARRLALKNVIFKYNISEEELNMYYANCLFTVHVAFNEPFGLVPVEAALHGKPSIVSNNGGTPEFIDDMKNGLLVNPYSPRDIAKAMNFLVKNENITIEMGMEAKQKALKNFTIEKSIDRLIEAIK